MSTDRKRQDIDDLEAFVGLWGITASFTPPGVAPPAAETSFEWLEGRHFLVQRWHIDHPGFSQRFTGTFDESGDVITGTFELSRDGTTWDHDFDTTYTRLRA
jgi:hypothetical protein